MDRRQHEGRILDTSAQGPDLVERPGQRHAARARHAAEAWAQARHTAHHGGVRDRPERLAAEREGHQSGRDGGGGSGARAPGAFVQLPWVAGAPTEPDIALGELPEAELRDEHRPRFVETPHDLGVALGHAAAEGRGPPGGGGAARVQQILGAPGEAV